ncbi:SDR family NAD(P)-dependent oxidoreductase, partial [Candidatus Pelagibacter sp.]|nr:SDR family NAD(P)-dependent oxidoreductase [Candidatus Pelagibacter sp.]
DRNTSKLNTNLIKYLDNQNVLITGGAGSIGSELVKQIYNTNSKKIILFDNNETELFRLLLNFKKQKVIPILGDICDEEYLRSIIKKFKIDYVFHAAAYKHLSILENNFQSAIKNNLIGTISVLKSLNKNVKNFTLISTDKAANPISNLGISKRLAEIFTLSWKKNKTSVVRFGNVFASRGSVLEVFLNQLKNNHPLTVSHRLVSRYFMSIKEACNLVLQTNSLNFKNSIYLLNMGKPIKIIKIAESLLKFFRLNEYPIKYTYLKKGEKINEILSSSNKKFKTKHKDIFVIKEKNYSEKKVNEFFNFLISNFEFIEKKNIQRKIKKFIN